jgi:4-amino-4-deoxy-L-arabinose transferase-like glycosyltransferase
MLLGVAFFFIYSYSSFTTPPKFASPDETANYFFARLYSQTGNFYYSDPLNNIAGGIIHSRASLYNNGILVPFKFLGFPLVDGVVASVLPEMLRFLTAICAIIGAWFLYILARDIFNSRIALLSAVLIFITPAYWYWTNLSMMENVLGITLFIIFLRYFWSVTKDSRPRNFVLAGLFLGLALLVRPDYILLVIPVGILFIVNWKRIRKRNLAYAVLPFLLTMGPFFLLNKELYGSFLETGQHLLRQYETAVPVPPFTVDNLIENSNIMLYFLPVPAICAVLGCIYCLKKKLGFQYIVFFVATLAVLALYYLGGRLGPADIHGSYFRYFLPVFLLSSPLIAYFLLNFRNVAVKGLLAVALIANAAVAFPAISDNNGSVEVYADLNQQIIQQTETDSVIFLDYWDKAIAPERRVGMIRDIDDPERGLTLSEISRELSEQGVPVYYYMDGRFKDLVDTQVLNADLALHNYQVTATSVKSLYRLGLLGAGDKAAVVAQSKN